MCPSCPARHPTGHSAASEHPAPVVCPRAPSAVGPGIWGSSPPPAALGQGLLEAGATPAPSTSRAPRGATASLPPMPAAFPALPSPLPPGVTSQIKSSLWERVQPWGPRQAHSEPGGSCVGRAPRPPPSAWPCLVVNASLLPARPMATRGRPTE